MQKFLGVGDSDNPGRRRDGATAPSVQDSENLVQKTTSFVAKSLILLDFCCLSRAILLVFVRRCFQTVVLCQQFNASIGKKVNHIKDLEVIATVPQRGIRGE